MAFRLLRCELYKLKRTPFVGLVALAACLFPVPAALLALNGGTDGSFLSLSFLLLVMLAGPLLLPVVGGCLAVLLFHRERDWETLKNLYTVPVRWSGLVAAKLFVVYLGCILFAVISLLAAAATIAATGTPVTSLFTSLAAAGLRALRRGPKHPALRRGVRHRRDRLGGSGLPCLSPALDLSHAGVSLVYQLCGLGAGGAAAGYRPLLSQHPAAGGALSGAHRGLRRRHRLAGPLSGGVMPWCLGFRWN